MPDPLATRLAHYKTLIDRDIAAYAAHVRAATGAYYGPPAALVTDVFLELLERDGKRLRGALTMAAYEMLGGQDQQMIVRAATALEMIHAYCLILDDIQDRSATRRGKPAAHTVLAASSAAHPNPAHTGTSLAINAAVAGNHAAQMLLAGLSVPDELRVKVLGIVNQALVVTAYGQTYDILNETAATDANIERAMQYKTAYYSFLNPLCVGMVLAGAGCQDTDAIRGYALPAGEAFQITNDIAGVFGDGITEPPLDDLRAGKRTLLTQYALTHAAAASQQILAKHLGDPNLTSAQAARCREVIRASGALNHAKTEAKARTAAALDALDLAPAHWRKPHISFLRGIATSLIL